MKIVSALIVAIVVGITTVSAATGSTSTGSTSAGSTSSGSTSTGTTSTGVTVPSSQGAGGPVRAWNYTTAQFELFPQCFPWTWMNLFLAGNISAIYENQRICREQRTIDFRF